MLSEGLSQQKKRYPATDPYRHIKLHIYVKISPAAASRSQNTFRKISDTSPLPIAVPNSRRSQIILPLPARALLRWGFSHDAHPGNRPPSHLRDHLAPRRRQDHVDREIPPLRQRHSPRRHRHRPQEPARHHLRLDGARKTARHLDLLDRSPIRLPGLRGQPPRHPRSQGLLRGHLPRAHRRRRRPHGDRRRQGHRAPDPQALRGLQTSRRPRVHVHEQVRPSHAQPHRSPR